MKTKSNRWRTTLGALLFLIAISGVSGAAGPGEAGPQQAARTEEFEIPDELLVFVQAHYVHGLPVADAIAKFDVTVEPALLVMLADEKHEAYAYNVALMLGLVGGEKAVDGLIKFLESAPEGSVSHARFLAYGTVPHALGFLAERGHSKALNYLLEHPSADAWSPDKVKWTTPALDRAYQPHFMTKLVIWGLSVAARPQSDALLKEMEVDVKVGRSPSMYAPDIATAIKRSSRIKTEGVWNVFANAGRVDQSPDN